LMPALVLAKDKAKHSAASAPEIHTVRACLDVTCFNA